MSICLSRPQVDWPVLFYLLTKTLIAKEYISDVSAKHFLMGWIHVSKWDALTSVIGYDVDIFFQGGTCKALMHIWVCVNIHKHVFFLKVPRYGTHLCVSMLLHVKWETFWKGPSEELIKLLPAEADEPPHSDLEAPLPLCVCIYTYIISPASSTHLPGCTNIKKFADTDEPIINIMVWLLTDKWPL